MVYEGILIAVHIEKKGYRMKKTLILGSVAASVAAALFFLRKDKGRYFKALREKLKPADLAARHIELATMPLEDHLRYGGLE